MLKVQRCPNCKKVNTAVAIAGGVTGTYKCNNCGYIGIFIEQPIIGREVHSKSDDLVREDLEEFKKGEKKK